MINAILNDSNIQLMNKKEYKDIRITQINKWEERN